MAKRILIALVAILIGGVAVYFYFEKKRIEKQHQQELAEQANAKDPWVVANEEWLAQVAQEEGAQKTQSGIVYKVLQQGEGAVPTKESTVRVHYEGSDINNKIFDSSYKRDEPTEFGVTQVIKGWTEVLCLMPVGSKWEVYIPAELAYGNRSTGNIYPNSALKFVIELLDIVE